MFHVWYLKWQASPAKKKFSSTPVASMVLEAFASSAVLLYLLKNINCMEHTSIVQRPRIFCLAPIMPWTFSSIVIVIVIVIIIVIAIVTVLLHN